MPSAFPSSLDVVGESGPIFSENLRKMSGGALDVKFFEPGALVPAFEVFNAVSKGSAEAGWTTPGFHVATIPAAPWFTTVPFGPNTGEYLAWLKYGGGHKLKDEIYARHGVKGISCITIAPEASGWFRKEIKSVDDLKGLKMRFFGLGARVMQKLGVQTQLDPARRHLPGPRARAHRRHRAGLPLHRPQAGLPPGRQALLLPGLASADLGGRVPGQPQEVEGALRGAPEDDRGGLRRQHHVDLRQQRGPPVRRHARAGGQARREDPLLVRRDPGARCARRGKR